MEPTGRHLRIARDEEAPLTARRWIEELAPSVPPEVRGDLTLLTHELVTSAVRHSKGDSVWVAALVCRQSVRREVGDDGNSSEPTVRRPKPFATSGRGLLWVKELSDRWGRERRRVNHVWFQIDLDSKEVVRSN